MLKYNKNEYNLYKTQFYHNPLINPISGRHIEINKGIYNKLVKEFGNPFALKEFYYFEQLPRELQIEIYSYNLKILIQALTVNKSSFQMIIPKLSELNINNKEYITYIFKMLPVMTYAFPYYDGYYKFSVTQFILNQYPTINKPLSYLYTINSITDNNFIKFKNTDGKYDFKSKPLLASEYDLITSFKIYKQRKMCQCIPNYAKNKTLKILTLKNTQIKNTYVKLLNWYFYLRCNLSQFHYDLPQHDYFNYIVIVGQDGQITNGMEHLLIQLKLDCEELYTVLFNYISNLV
jgi:hypothetical protein